MAYFTLLWKARTIEKYRLNYEREKLNSIRLSQTQIEKQSVFQRFWQYNVDIKNRSSQILRKWYPEGSSMHKLIVYLNTDQTFPNFVLKSAIGFVGGIILTYLCFMFFVFQLSISLIHSTIMSSIIGVLLTLGLAFSYRIRCLVFLLIPQFFSRVGRYTLTCYALVLILTGPATNTLKNSEVLSESMACGQEQIKTSVNEMNESIKKPLIAVKDNIKTTVDRMKQIAAHLKDTLLKIQRLVLSITGVFRSSFGWLNYLTRTCNKKLGTPYKRCITALNESVLDCQARLGTRYSWLCNSPNLVEAICWSVRPLKRFCYAVEYVNENIWNAVNKKLKIFSSRVEAMLFVQVDIHHSYSFSSNGSRSASQVAAGIVTEIRNRADPLLTWLSWSSCVTSLFLLLIIFRAKYYQHMFETRSRFDNRYITKELRELDLKRLRQGRETVLPLNRREKAKYIQATSFRLVPSEKVHLSRSLIFMVMTTFKLMIHMVADYSLYWVLMNIRYHGRFQTPLQQVPDTGAHISGSGPVTRFLRSIIEALTQSLTIAAPSPVYCLPDPYPPDLQRYMQIGILIFLLWFFALFEPYGLRLRHLIMRLYRPERATARAAWLFNHIQRTRAGFMKYARRKLHREFKYSSEQKHTFTNWLNSHIPSQCLRNLLGTCPGEPRCLLCNTIEYPDDHDTCLVRCETIKCPGTFCTSCFSDIGQLCTLCLSPADYGDMSDVSLEKGSSAENSSDEHGSDSDSTPDNDPDSQICKQCNLTSETNDKKHSNERRDKKSTEDCLEKRKNTEQDAQDEILILKYTDEILQNECHGRILRRATMVRHRRHIAKNLEHKCYDFASKKNCQDVANFESPLPIPCQSCKSFYYRESKSIGFIQNQTIIPVVNNIGKVVNILQIPNVKNYETNVQKPDNENKRINNILNRLNYFKQFKLYDSCKRITTRFRKLQIKENKISRRTSNWVHINSSLRKRKKKISKSFRKRSRSEFNLKWPNNICCFQFSTVSYAKNHMQPSITSKKVKRKGRDKINKRDQQMFVMKPGNITILYCGETEHQQVPFKGLKLSVNVDESKNCGNSKEQKNQLPMKSDDSNTFCQYMGKFRNVCCDYWKNTKLNLSIISSIKLLHYLKKPDTPHNFVKTNYKRRKKSDLDELDTYEVNPHKVKKDNEAIRKYRISTYLSDQDWLLKGCYENVDNSVKKLGMPDNIKELKPKAENYRLKDAELVEIYKKKKRENMAKFTSPEPKAVGRVNQLNLQERNPLQTAPNKNRIWNRIKNRRANHRNIISSSSTVSRAEQMLNKLCASQATLTEGSDKTIRPFDVHTSRPLNFYKSLGHHDFDSDLDTFINDLFTKDREKKKGGEKVKLITEKKYLCHSSHPNEDTKVKDNSHCGVCPEKINISRDDDKVQILDNSPQKIDGKEKKIPTQKDLKRSSKIGFRSPMSIMKSIFSCNFIGKRKKNKCSPTDKKEEMELGQANLDAPRVPMESCAYQHLEEVQPLKDDVTIKNIPQTTTREFGQDAEINANNLRNRGTQYIGVRRNVGTYFKRIHKLPSKDATTLHYNALRRIQSFRDVATVHFNCFRRFHNSAVQCCRNIRNIYYSRSRSTTETYSPNIKQIHTPHEMHGVMKHSPNTRRTYGGDTQDATTSFQNMKRKYSEVDKNTNKIYSPNIKRKHPGIVNRRFQHRSLWKDTISSVDTTHSRSSSVRSDEGTKTDTTECRYCAVDYSDETPKKKKLRRLKVSVVTKSNQSTVTEKKTCCDASTVTKDWWSPMVEKKVKEILLEKKNGDYIFSDKKIAEKIVKKSRGVWTEGKIVKFQSIAQIIPVGNDDILSPSRYLLESQRYYNELYSPKFYSPHIVAISSVPRRKLGGKRSPIQTRYGNRPKRLETRYSPRKMTEYKYDDEIGNQSWSSKFRNQQRIGTKLNVKKKSRNFKRQVIEKGTIGLRNEQNLARGFNSDDILSVICQCEISASANTTGSF